MLTSIAPTLLWCATGLPSGADATDHHLARLGREVGELSSGLRPAVRPFAGQAGNEGVPGLSVELYPLDVPTPVVERTDPTIDFTWRSGAPATGIPANRFGATWTGEVVPTVSGDYTFIARTDDGVRLYIDGTLVIDRWVNQSARDVRSTAVKLKKDKAVSLRMEYYENTGQASARLSWSLDGGPAMVIPQANLRSADRLNAFPPVLTGPTSGTGTVQVGASTPLDGGVIHYTVDGTDPKSSSPAVSDGVITLTASANLRAAVRGSDGKFGPVATRTITVLGGGTGLLASYIGGTNPGAAPLLSRTDTGLYFNWRAAPPAAGLPADYFTARWEGELVPAWSEATTFSLGADDGARVYLGGKLIIDRFHGTGASTATVNLTAGQALPLVVEYVELAGNAAVRLRWQSASMSRRDIPTAALRPLVQSVPDATGRGLAASYFANPALTGTPAVVRVEPRLDWRWGATAPAAGLAVDGWSARWEGAIIPRFTETYTLSIAADDGVRVWIDGVQKLNDWRSRGHRTLSTTVALTAGRAHAIRIEKSDVSGNAGATLLWSSLSQQREVVPSWRLLPSRPPTVEELALAGDEDSTIAGTAVASDPDGDVLAWSVKTQPGHGSVSVDAATGAVSYVPDLNYNGPDGFVLLVKDAFTETELPVSVAVAPVNDAPVASALSLSGDEDGVLTGQALASDVEGDPLTWSLASQTAYGTATVDANTGAVSYQPNADFAGADSFALMVSDGNGGSATADVAVTVNAVDDAAVITVPAGGSVTPGSDLALGAIQVADIDSPTVTVQVSVDAGTITLVGQPGAVAAASHTLTGTPAEVTAALAQPVWRAPSAAGPATLTVAGNGGTASVALTTLAAPGPIVVQPLAVTEWEGEPQATQLLPAPAAIWNVDVTASGRYHFWLRGSGASVAVELDGGSVGSISLPPTSGWSCLSDGTALTLDLAAGQHQLRCVAPAGAITQLMLVAETPIAAIDSEPAIVGLGAVTVLRAAEYDATAVGLDGFSWLPANGRMIAQPDILLPGGTTPPRPRLDYHVYVAKAGTYQVWFKGFGDVNGDSLRVGLDGVQVVEHLTGVSGATSPAWSNQLGFGGSVQVTISSAGDHTINLWPREDGVQVEQLAISGIPTWTPQRYAVVPAQARSSLHGAKSDGTFAVTATAATQLLPGSRGHAWQAQAGSPSALQLLPDSGQGNGSSLQDYGTAASMTWWVRIDDPGTWQVWLRAAGPDTNGDSVFVSAGGGLLGDITYTGLGAGLPLLWTSQRLNRTPVTLSVAAGQTGLIPITVWMREDGVLVDRLVLQAVGAPAPTSEPEASPLVNPPSPTQNG